MSTETSLWKWLDRGVDFMGAHELQMTRIENAATSGVPDVEGQEAKWQQFWVELKVAARPHDLMEPVKVPHFRAKQVQWCHNRALIGGRAWILLRLEGANRPTTHYLLHGLISREVAAGRLSEPEMARISAVRGDCAPVDIIRAASRGPLAYQLKR